MTLEAISADAAADAPGADLLQGDCDDDCEGEGGGEGQGEGEGEGEGEGGCRERRGSE